MCMVALEAYPLALTTTNLEKSIKKEQTLNNEVKGRFRSQIKGEIFTKIDKVARLVGKRKDSY